MKSRQAASLVGNGSAKWARTPRLPHAVSKRAAARAAEAEERVLEDPRRPGGLPHNISYLDRKSTRLNSSHLVISYAVFCLKKKKKHVAVQYKPPDKENHDQDLRQTTHP